MKSRRSRSRVAGVLTKRTIWLAVILVVAILPIVALGFADPGALRVHFVSYADFRQLDDRVFVSPSFPEANSARLSGLIRDAEARVSELFDGYSADPWIIVAADPESAERYSFNLHETIHVSSFGAHIVLGPKGLADINVVAHELAHAEHLERVGLPLWWLTPAWFKEGLAMQVDHRPEYGQSALDRARAAGEPVREVHEMISFEQFSRGDLTLNYAAAREAMALIYRELGPSGLSSFLRRQGIGTSFTSLLDEASVRAPDAQAGTPGAPRARNRIDPLRVAASLPLFVALDSK